MNARYRSGLTITVAAILMMLAVLSSCSTSDPASPTYNAAIQEGQSAAQEAIKGGASNSTAYDLGWDSVMQPGLQAVGFDGWSKGGDTTGYHAAIVVSPTAQLGVVVIGASGFGSEKAILIAERVLLRALAENGRIAKFPAPLPSAVPPAATVPDGLLSAIAGYYSEGSFFIQLTLQPDGSLLFNSTFLKYRNDGWFTSDQDPLQAYKVIDAGGTQYFVKRAPGGYGHYLDQSVEGQRVCGTGGNLSAAWSARLSAIWLVVNENPDSSSWKTMDPRLRVGALADLNGLILFLFRFPCDGGSYIVDPSASDWVAMNRLIIPQLNGVTSTISTSYCATVRSGSASAAICTSRSHRWL